MKNTIILITGIPAVGKTTFANWLSSEICVPLVSHIRVIEKYLEISGANFGDEEQRRTFGHIPTGLFWFFCDEIMKSFSPLIIECMFNNQMRSEAINLIEKHKYQTINIHLDTSVEIAHRRFCERQEDNPSIKGTRPDEIPFDIFEKNTKEIKDYRFGNQIINVDTTDFSVISYTDIIEQIRQYTLNNE